MTLNLSLRMASLPSTSLTCKSLCGAPRATLGCIRWRALLRDVDLGQDIVQPRVAPGDHAVVLAGRCRGSSQAGRHRQDLVVEQCSEDQEQEAQQGEPRVRHPGRAE